MQLSDDANASYRVKLDSAGRLLIPAVARHRLGIAQGDEVVVEIDTHGMRIIPVRQALKDLRAYFAGIKKPGKSIVDELIKERREDAAHE